MTTIQQQSVMYIKGIAERRRDPVSLSTKKTYDSFLKTWILPRLGEVKLAEFDNRVMREFVEELVKKGLSASSIAGITNCVKDVIKSCQDQNGNVIYLKTWNADFIDAPQIDPGVQKAPTIGSSQLLEAIRRCPDQYRSLYTLLAGSGLRISEALALKCGLDDGVNSFYLPENSKVIVRKQIKFGQFQAPKTRAGVREVDLAPELNAILCNETPLLGGFLYRSETGGPARIQTLYDVNDKIGVPGFHSLRRFRVTHLRSESCPEDILKFWIGHSTNQDITDRYSKLGQYVQLRKEWSRKVGLGF